MAVDKLKGWSVVVDVFHGANHDIARSIRTAVRAIGPALIRLSREHAETPAIGMDCICRVMCDMQQVLERVLLLCYDCVDADSDSND